jgi:hypothetical protein
METQKQLTPMQDLLIDLKDTKSKAKESLNLIENEIVRKQVNLITETILDCIINRIRDELLQAEKNVIVEAYRKGNSADPFTTSIDNVLFAEGYYNNHYFTGAIPSKPKTNIREIEMPVRLGNCFKRLGIVYLEEVVEKYKEKDFLQFINFGEKSILDLKLLLEKHNLKFKK